VFALYNDIAIRQERTATTSQGGHKMLKISLKAARINADLSQKEVAKKCNVSNKTVCSWENGNSFPSADKIAILCDLYKIPYDNINFLPNNSLKANEENCSKNV
jgi:transcriptional regulator with XRE-family HTH domain